MHFACAFKILALSMELLVQSPVPCPAGRPVDDIISEVHKQQSKEKHRKPNPVPDVICVWGWCRDRSKKETPPTVPESSPQMETHGGNGDTGSGGIAANNCQEAMEMALEAAHNVDVGDYYFSAKNYNGALMRYRDADEEKPGDAAIQVRSGRALEKLARLPEAIQEYKAAEQIAIPEKWSDEAKAALVRLERHAR